MKKAILVSLFTALLGGVSTQVMAQSSTTVTAPNTILFSDLTGLRVLRIVADQRNVTVPDSRLLTLRSSPPVDPEFVQLCLSKITYDALVKLANFRVPQVLATRAALEAATCKSFSTAAIQNYLNSGALKPIVTAEDLANQIKKPIIGGGVTAVDGTSVTPVRP